MEWRPTPAGIPAAERFGLCADLPKRNHQWGLWKAALCLELLSAGSWIYIGSTHFQFTCNNSMCVLEAKMFTTYIPACSRGSRRPNVPRDLCHWDRKLPVCFPHYFPQFFKIRKNHNSSVMVQKIVIKQDVFHKRNKKDCQSGWPWYNLNKWRLLQCTPILLNNIWGKILKRPQPKFIPVASRLGVFFRAV